MDQEKKVFIHIGLHKTGTTFLQTKVFNKFKSVHYIQDDIKELSNPKSLGKKNILISWEGFSGRPWYGLKTRSSQKYDLNVYSRSFETSIDNLKSLSSKITIIIFVRKHSEFLMSLYKQYVKKGGVLKFSEFYGNNKLIQPSEILLKPKLDLLLRSFDGVHIFDYEDLKLRPDSVFKKLGVIFGEESIPQINPTEKVNHSLDLESFELMRRYNKFFYSFPNIFIRIFRRLGLNPERLIYKLAKMKIKIISPPFDSEEFEEINNQDFETDWKNVLKLKEELQ